MGIGILFLVVGVLRYVIAPEINLNMRHKEKGAKFAVISVDRSGSESVIGPNWPAIRSVTFGTVFSLLGITLSIGLRRVMRNGGIEVASCAHSDAATSSLMKPDCLQQIEGGQQIEVEK
jgi:hypothetical protein